VRTFSLGLGALLIAGCTPRAASEAPDDRALARESTEDLIVDIDLPARITQSLPATLSVATVAPRRGESIEVTVDGVAGPVRQLVFEQSGPQVVTVEAVRIDAGGVRTTDTERVNVEVAPARSIGCSLSPAGAYTVTCVLSEGTEPAPGPSYEWLVGGISAVSSGALAPVVTVDLAPQMDHEQLSTSFVVSATDPATREVVRAEVVLGSHVYLGLQQGLLLPQLSPPLLDGRSCPIEADFEVRNPVGDDWVVFDRYVRRIHRCDPAAPSWSADIPALDLFGDGVSSQVAADGYPASPDGPSPTGPGRLSIPPDGVLAGHLSLPCDEIPPGTCALEYDLVGTSRAGRHVQASLWVRTGSVEAPPPSPTTRATLAALQEDGLVSSEVISEEELLALQASGVVTLTPAGWELP
jgi:hypothetical protein